MYILTHEFSNLPVYHTFQFLLKSKSINFKYTWLILEYIMINRNDSCLEYLENCYYVLSRQFLVNWFTKNIMAAYINDKELVWEENNSRYSLCDNLNAELP